jgi:hypothetical protein
MKIPSNWTRQLEQIRDTNSTVGINLLLTKKCNFKCDQCMFRSGPQEQSLYMSYDVWSQILSFASQLGELGLQVEYNMVGGEPTLNMPKFKDFCTWIGYDAHEHQVEMTTNGWWLKHVDNIVSFTQAVGMMALKDQLSSIRISDSPFHTPWRSEKAAARMRTLIGGRLDDYITEWAWEDRDDGSGDLDSDERDEQVYRGLDSSKVSAVSKLTHVDCQRGGHDGVTPTGRAGDFQLGAASGHCQRHDSILFTFNPDGSLHDFCCNGGKVKAGHASDGLALLWRRISYMDFIHRKVPTHENKSGERCRQCEYLGREWRKSSTRDYALTAKFGTPRLFESALEEQESFPSN